MLKLLFFIQSVFDCFNSFSEVSFFKLLPVVGTGLFSEIGFTHLYFIFFILYGRQIRSGDFLDKIVALALASLCGLVNDVVNVLILSISKPDFVKGILALLFFFILQTFGKGLELNILLFVEKFPFIFFWQLVIIGKC